jgi:ferric-dicitrate binding protein FerR (iron transport regulator)
MLRHILSCGLLAATALLGATPLRAEEPVGKLIEVQGTLFLHKGAGSRYEKLDAPGAAVMSGDLLRTSSTSRGVVRLADGSRLLLDERSTLQFKSAANAALQGGTVLFDLNKQGRLSGFTVNSPVATIGIRGTQFAVEMSGDRDTSIYLEKGSIEVLPVEEQFKRYRSGIRGEFDDYKKQQEKDAAEYRRRLEQEYFEYVSGFVMEPGSAVAIRGNEVRDAAPGERLRRLMKEFFGASTLEH